MKKEAAANALVCLRWRNLWTLTPNLDFDASKSNSGYRVSVLRPNFFRFVDGVIASHRNPNLERFRLVSDLGSPHTKIVDRWLRYALRKKVQSLELTFFGSLLSIPTVDDHGFCHDFPHKRVGVGDFKHLKQLTLHSVNVTGEAVEHLVQNAPLLEHLSVSFSQVLSSLEIVGPSPLFKCLELNLCYALKSVAVRDSDIVTIKYCGITRIRFVLLNVPLLTQLWVGGLVTERIDDIAGLMFASVFPHLHTLNIHFIYSGNLYEKLPHKRVERGSLIDATAETTGMTPKTIHFHLKEVEFVGYRGVSAQLELIMHLGDYAVVLQNIIIDPCTFTLTPRPTWRRIPLHEFDYENFARARAQDLLKHIVPKKIGLKIL